MNTDALALRNRLYDVLAGMPGWVTLRKVSVVPHEVSKLPALGVYLLRSTRAAEGDVGTGPPSFIEDTTIGFNIIVTGNTPDSMEDTLDLKVRAVEELILGHPVLMSSIEGVVSSSATYHYPQDAETHFAEARLEFIMRYRVDWEPRVPDDLLMVRVTTRPMDKPNSDMIEQQIDYVTE